MTMAAEAEPKDIPAGNSPAERLEKVYSTLPLPERKRPIIFIGDEPVNWEMAYREVSNNTQLGEKIAKKLIEMDLI